ncbi:MAG: hypothetical protein WBL50_11480 [Candidatus Acidiferrum sp.]
MLALDSKSFLYAVSSSHDVTFFRQSSKEGNPIVPPQGALKIPFTFTFGHRGNGYDFSRDLSTIVYVQPVGHSDLYRFECSVLRKSQIKKGKLKWANDPGLPGTSSIGRSGRKNTPRTAARTSKKRRTIADPMPQIIAQILHRGPSRNQWDASIPIASNLV